MTAIQDFAAKQSIANDQLDAAVKRVSDEFAVLRAQIANAQVISPEDQAALDNSVARTNGAVEALNALVTPAAAEATTADVAAPAVTG